MSVQPLLGRIVCPYCGIGLIGRVVTYNLRDNRNYLNGIVITTKYMYFRGRAIVYQEVRNIQV